MSRKPRTAPCSKCGRDSFLAEDDLCFACAEEPVAMITVVAPAGNTATWAAALSDESRDIVAAREGFKLGWDAFSWAMKQYADMKAAS